MEHHSPAAGPGGIGRYLYGIVESDEALDWGDIGIGDEGSRVFSVNHRGLAAVVSHVPLGVLVEPTRRNLKAHEFVGEAILRTHTVLPVSFGTIFRTEKDVMALLRMSEDALRVVLEKVRGTIEVGLKGLWDPDGAVAKIQAENPEVTRLKREIDGSKASTFYTKLQLGSLIDNELEKSARRYVTELFESIRPVCLAGRTSRLIGERMILNVALLVRREREEELDDIVTKLDRKYGDVLSLRRTGARPPSNFVDVRMELERRNDEPAEVRS